MQSLLEVSGGKCISIEDFDSNSQELPDAENNRLVLVNPSASIVNSRHSSTLSKVNEIDLVSAVISGYLDPLIIIAPAVIISSSCSTGETIVADSDAETETATSDNPITSSVAAETDIRTVKTHMDHPSEADGTVEFKQQYTRKMTSDKKDTPYERKVENPTKSYASSLGNDKAAHFVEPNRALIGTKVEDLESANVDILYSQNLIVRDVKPLVSNDSLTQDGVINFKRFRKTNTQSGNSFSNLVPFAKFPYTDSDYDKEVTEYMKEEKKRKQMEAMAEDLFNTEKGRRRGGAGSLRGLLGLN